MPRPIAPTLSPPTATLGLGDALDQSDHAMMSGISRVRRRCDLVLEA